MAAKRRPACTNRRRVRKDHPRIAFRGALDELLAQTICCQLTLQREAESGVERRLAGFPQIIRQMMSAEYTGEPFEIELFFALEWEELHEMSHHPKKYFGMDHPIITADLGESVCALNLLRTKARQCERLAVSAFDAKREDIVHALNRMSSALYVFLCELCAKRETICR